ncbi:unnamed protein product [Cladocopium goreaui]|uniref:Uncharacterized protein n=1 Tax=Cladocopium goreaui TaxID=2562237 RepID=A0A9P1C8G2_9DINO|nr:unnamed protein product [Cladocopium goreaui]
MEHDCGIARNHRGPQAPACEGSTGLEKGWSAEGTGSCLRRVNGPWKRLCDNSALKKAGLQKAPGSGLRRVNGPWKRLCDNSALKKAGPRLRPAKSQRALEKAVRQQCLEKRLAPGSGLRRVNGPWKRLCDNSALKKAGLAPGLGSACEESTGLGKGCATTVRSLRCALESLESAYYEVRQRSVQSLAEDEALGVSRGELMETLKKAGCRLTETEQDVLWEAMDTNQDGLLSASELGLSDANNDAPILEERQERRPGGS